MQPRRAPISRKSLVITCHEIVSIFSRQAAQMRREFENAPGIWSAMNLLLLVLMKVPQEDRSELQDD